MVLPDDVADAALADRLRAAGLRCTPARTEVLRALASAGRPLTHREATEVLPSMDRVTVFRNLTTLVDAGLALRVDPGDRVWRYAVVDPDQPAHDHPHFTCVSCGETTCLDEVRVEGPAAWVDGAEVQLRGTCGACR